MKKYASHFGSLVLSFLSLVFALTLPGCSAADVPTFLNQVASMVGGWAPASAIIVAILEFFIRLVPSANPMSLILLTSKILHALGNVCDVVSKFLDGLGLQVIQPVSEKLVDKKP